VEIEVLKRYTKGEISIIELLLKSKMAYKTLKTIYELNNQKRLSIGVRQLGEMLGYKNVISRILKIFQSEDIINFVNERIFDKKKSRKVAYLTPKGEILFKQVKKRKIMILKKKLEMIKRELKEL
jgi:DNA-binding MarR family transcriptional regulator